MHHISLVDSHTQLIEKRNTEKWFALYTRSRHEKVVASELEKKGIETFLPLRKIVRHWSDRTKIIEEPLFKSYLFVHAALSSRLSILQTIGVVNILGKNAAEPFEVPDKDLKTLQQLIETEIKIDPFPYLKMGERVYIRSGPFKGVEGFIVRKDKHCRLVVSLDLLMQSISVVLDEACVEAV